MALVPAYVRGTTFARATSNIGLKPQKKGKGNEMPSYPRGRREAESFLRTGRSAPGKATQNASLARRSPMENPHHGANRARKRATRYYEPMPRRRKCSGFQTYECGATRRLYLALFRRLSRDSPRSHLVSFRLGAILPAVLAQRLRGSGGADDGAECEGKKPNAKDMSR